MSPVIREIDRLSGPFSIIRFIVVSILSDQLTIRQHDSIVGLRHKPDAPHAVTRYPSRRFGSTGGVVRVQRPPSIGQLCSTRRGSRTAEIGEIKPRVELSVGKAAATIC